MDIFGPEVLKSDSPEYEPANQKRDYPDKVNLGDHDRTQVGDVKRRRWIPDGSYRCVPMDRR